MLCSRIFSGSSPPYQLPGLLFAKPYLCCGSCWGGGAAPGCQQLERAKAVGISLQHLWAPGPSPWQMDLIPPACPKEVAEGMKWLCLDGAFALEIRFKKRLSIPAEWLCSLAGVCFH